MRKVRLGMAKLTKVQKLLGFSDETSLPMTTLANAIAEKCNWPLINPSKKAARYQIYKYLQFMETNTNFVPSAYVYFIQLGQSGPIKIGVANDVDSRLMTLQTANPSKLTAIAKIGCKSKTDAYMLEKDLHRKFSHLRQKGEWFNPRLIKKLKDICDEYKI